MSVNTVGEREKTELLADFPPLLECLRYMMDCTFSRYSLPSDARTHTINELQICHHDFRGGGRGDYRACTSECIMGFFVADTPPY